jgi:hypothetical protein
MKLVEKIIKENEEAEEKIREHNMEVFKKFLNGNNPLTTYIVNEVPGNVLDEVGAETFINYLAKEEKTTMFEPQHHVSVKLPQREEGEDELEYIIRSNKLPPKEQLFKKLVWFFMRRVVANVPRDRVLNTFEDVQKFIKTYEMAYIYNYVIPYSKV